MNLNEIRRLRFGVSVYTTPELVELINRTEPNIGTALYKRGLFKITGNTDHIVNKVNDVIRDKTTMPLTFNIADVELDLEERLWHIVDQGTKE